MTREGSPPLSDEAYAYSDYSQPDPPHQPLYLDFLTRMLRTDPSIETVLDAGCGDGNFTKSLADAGFRMYGIDLSDGGVERARRRYPDVSFARASVYDDFREVFPDCPRFDAIVSIEVIEHLYSPRIFVKRAREAVRPGGLVIVTTPYWGYLKNIVLAVTGRIDRYHTALWDGGHIKHWSRKTLTKLFEEQGFERIAFYGAGRPIPFLWNGMALAFRQRSSGPKS